MAETGPHLHPRIPEADTLQHSMTTLIFTTGHQHVDSAVRHMWHAIEGQEASPLADLISSVCCSIDSCDDC